MSKEEKVWQALSAEEITALVDNYAAQKDLELTSGQVCFCTKNLQAKQDRQGYLCEADLDKTVRVLLGDRLLEADQEQFSSADCDLKTPSQAYAFLMNRGRGRPSGETLEWLRNEYLRLSIEQQQLYRLFNEIKAAFARYEQGLMSNPN